MVRLPFPPSTGTYRVLAVPMLEAGQDFRDGDLTGLADSLRTRLFDTVRDFWLENSYNQLTVEFDVFGHDVIPLSQPLQLSQPLVNYWTPRFEAGGIDAVEAGLGANPTISFDGTESTALDIEPRLRPDKTITVTFPAVMLAANHADFPVSIDFANTDSLQLEVTDMNGDVRNLDVAFTTQNFTVEAATDETDLAAIATYIDDRITVATAELGLPVAAPQLFDTTEVARISTDDPAELGTLLCGLSLHPDYADGTATAHVTGVTGLADLGAQVGDEAEFTLPGERFALETYLRRRLELAQEIAGFDLGNRLLGDVDVDFDGGTLTIALRMSDEDGGVGSSLAAANQTNLDKIGFDNVTVVPGVATDGTSATVRDAEGLISEIFTLINDSVGAGDQTGWFFDPGREYTAVYIVFLGTPPATAPTWDAGPANADDLRMFRSWRTGFHEADGDIQLRGNWITSVLEDPPSVGTACHELGHSLGGEEGTHSGGVFIPHDWCFGLADTYDNDPENQNDLRYMEAFDLMGRSRSLSHVAGFHKRHLGWIPDSRIHQVPLPNPSGQTDSECWLVPIEHWSPSMETQVRNVVGGTLPIRQLIDIVLPGDGARMLMVEARTEGDIFSKSLPFDPALLITDGIECSDAERYVVNFKYRRHVHPLNIGDELQSAPAVYDLATAPEIPHEGTTVEVVATENVAGSTVFHVRVTREQADFIDLRFTDANPSWRNPDLWIDWPGNGTETYAVGTPYHQGDTVMYPAAGTEPHDVVARVHNQGTIAALDIEVRFYIWEPAGAGDRGEFTLFDQQIIPQVGNGAFEPARATWDVTSANNSHQCMLAQISDWTIPQASSGGPVPVYEGSTDLWLHNNRAQKNIVDFDLVGSSPFEDYTLQLAISNDGPEDITVYLEPVHMPLGYMLSCSPRELVVPATSAAEFSVTVGADVAHVQPNVEFDATFVVAACRWTRDKTNVVPFGGWEFNVRPRTKSDLEISAVPDTPYISVTGVVTGTPASGIVWVRAADDHGRTIVWQPAGVAPNGSVHTVLGPIEGVTGTVLIEAHYRGNDFLSAARTGPITVHLPAAGLPGGGLPPVGGGGGGVVTGPLPVTHGHHEEVEG